MKIMKLLKSPKCKIVIQIVPLIAMIKNYKKLTTKISEAKRWKQKYKRNMNARSPVATLNSMICAQD